MDGISNQCGRVKTHVRRGATFTTYEYVSDEVVAGGSIIRSHRLWRCFEANFSPMGGEGLRVGEDAETEKRTI